MTCPACGFQGLESEDHRCRRCGRRLDAPLDSPVPHVTSGGAAAAPAPAPEWRRSVSQRVEEFRNRRARQERLFEDESGETVPAPDRNRKVLAYEDFAPDRIEPVVVRPPEPPRRAVLRTPPSREIVSPPPEPAEPSAAAPPSGFLRDIRCSAPVAALPLRALSGVLDAALVAIAAGVFGTTFYLLAGDVPPHPRVVAPLALAGACLGAFYLYLYVVYGGETPGMQWTGLRLLDYEGRPPRRSQRVIRVAATFLSGAALGLGYLWSLVDEEGLTWHDRMSQTFLSRDESAPRHFRAR